MANDQGIAYGAFPITQPDSPPKLLYLRANTALNIFRGAYVFINNSGQCAQGTSTANNNSAIGVAWTFLDTNRAGLPSAMTTLTQGAYLPSATDAVVGFTYDPMQLYLMEEQTGGTVLGVNSIGQTVGFTYIATTGNTTTGFANTVIVNTSVSSGTDSLLQLLGFYDITNRDSTANASGAAAKHLVRIFRHQLGNGMISLPQA